MGTVRRWLAMGAAAAAITGGTVSPAGAAPVTGYGAWFSNFPCTFTDPPIGTNEFACLGSNDWTGTLNAVTYFTGEGTYDAVTQASAGTWDERVVLVAIDGTHGTLHLIHQFTIRPVTDGANALQFDSIAKVVGGTGGFKDASGKIKFNGVYSYLCCGAGVLLDQPSKGSVAENSSAHGTMTGKVTVPDQQGGRRTIPVS